MRRKKDLRIHGLRFQTQVPEFSFYFFAKKYSKNLPIFEKIHTFGLKLFRESSNLTLHASVI